MFIILEQPAATLKIKLVHAIVSFIGQNIIFVTIELIRMLLDDPEPGDFT